MLPARYVAAAAFVGVILRKRAHAHMLTFYGLFIIYWRNFRVRARAALIQVAHNLLLLIFG